MRYVPRNIYPGGILYDMHFRVLTFTNRKLDLGPEFGSIWPAEGYPSRRSSKLSPQPVDRQTHLVHRLRVAQEVFVQIAAVVAELDGIIRERDYDAWVSRLSREYIAGTGSAEFLEEASKSARLSSRKIVLRSLEDYFVNVVVQSRLQATLDQIVFVDESNVKAMTVVNEESYILYWLVREDGRWKIGIVQDRVQDR
jgi:hypothetical protein